MDDLRELARSQEESDARRGGEAAKRRRSISHDTPEQRRTQLARAVRLALHHRSAQAQERSQQQVGARAAEHRLVADALSLSIDVVEKGGLDMAAVEDLVWNRFVRQAQNELKRHHCLHRDTVMSIVQVVLWRYLRARDAALSSCTKDSPVLCSSLRIKWDETQQEVLSNDPATGQITPLTASVLVVQAWFGNSTMAPQPIVCPPCRLMRLTSDCIHNGMCRQIPLLRGLPLGHMSTWMVIVMIADDASSNRRLVAYCRLVFGQQRKRVILLHVRCFVHLLHRCAIPCLTLFALAGPLYRAANLMSLSSYWIAMCRSLEAHISNNLDIVHHMDADPGEQRIAEKLLRLTLLQGLPDEAHTKSTLALRDEALEVISGDWKSQRFLFRCDGSCGLVGARFRCKSRAVERLGLTRS